MLTRRTARSSVFQVDPSRCAACDLCRTSCVLSQSAVKAVNDFTKCGYCQLCPSYFDVTSQPDEKGLPTGKTCPQDALKRRVVGKVDTEIEITTITNTLSMNRFATAVESASRHVRLRRATDLCICKSATTGVMNAMPVPSNAYVLRARRADPAAGLPPAESQGEGKKQPEES